jgi:hypothetical protein
MGRSDVVGSRRNWILRMQRFARCDLTVAAFCDRERVSVSAFYHWRKKLAEPVRWPQEQTEAEPRPTTGSQALFSKGFIPVQLLQAAVIEVRLVNGVRLSLPASDLEALRQTLQIVSQLPTVADSGTEGARC